MILGHNSVILVLLVLIKVDLVKLDRRKTARTHNFLATHQVFA